MRAKSLSRRACRLRVLALLGISGQVVFVLVVALLPLFQPDYSSVDDPISFLLRGPYGFVQSGAFFASGLGSLALAVGIRRTTRGTRGSLLGSVLIGLWAIGFALAGVVLTDAEGNPTETMRVLHSAAAMLAFVSAPAGMLLLSWVFAREVRWASFYPLSLALGVGALVGLTDMVTVHSGIESLIEAVGPMARGFFGLGILQRVFVGTLVLWMMLAAVRLRSLDKSSRTGGNRGKPLCQLLPNREKGRFHLKRR